MTLERGWKRIEMIRTSPQTPEVPVEVRDGISPKKKRFSAQEENGTDWDQALIQAATNARAMGQLPKGVDILVKECFSPTLSWDALLARFYSAVCPAGLYLDAAQSQVYSPEFISALPGIGPVA